MTVRIEPASFRLTLRLALRLLSSCALALTMWAASSTAAFAFDTRDLMSMLATVEHSDVAFEETKYLAALTAPLARRGTMHYVRPDRLEMRVEKPYFERLSVVGSKLTIESSRGTRQIDLATQPVASAWVESLRATLAGDATSIARQYRARVDGDRGAWKLVLEPLDTTLASVVKGVEISGSQTRIEQILIDEQQGDRTRLKLSALPGMAQ